MTTLLDRLASGPVVRTVRRLMAILATLVLLGSLVAVGALASVRSTLETYRDEVTPLVESSSRLRLAVSEVDNHMHLDIVESSPESQRLFAASVAEARDALAQAVAVSDPVVEVDTPALERDVNDYLTASQQVTEATASARPALLAQAERRINTVRTRLIAFDDGSIRYRDNQRDAYFTKIAMAAAGMIVSGLLGLLVILAMGRWAIHGLAGPLIDLRTVVDDQHRGLVRAADERRGPDEVRALAASFNQLTAANQELAGQQAHTLEMSRLTTSVAGVLNSSSPESWTLAAQVLGEGLGMDSVVVYTIDEGPEPHVETSWYRESDTPPRLMIATATAHGPEMRELTRRVVRAAGSVQEIAAAFPPRLAELAAAQDVGAWAVRPLELGEDIFGVLSIWSHEERAWTPDELQAVERCSSYLAQALSTRRVVRSLRELDRKKSRFMAVTSHELRTPLTSITGYVEMLSEGDFGDLTEEQCSALEVIDRNVGRLAETINDLLTLNKLTSGGTVLRRRPLPLVQGVRWVHSTFDAAAARRGVTLVTEEPPDAQLLGDWNQVERAIGNLITNALKFTPEGGTVRVSSEADEGTVTIAVSDSGIGIPEADQATIFEPFTRGSNAEEQEIPGTGLGLPIVRSIVEEHGGSVALTSIAGEGTTFRLTFPRADTEGPDDAVITTP